MKFVIYYPQKSGLNFAIGVLSIRTWIKGDSMILHLENNMFDVFFKLRARPIAFPQFTNFETKQFTSVNVLWREVPVSIMLASSAYKTNFATWFMLGRSVMKMTKSRGPRFDPWGTPHSINGREEWHSWIRITDDHRGKTCLWFHNDLTSVATSYILVHRRLLNNPGVRKKKYGFCLGYAISHDLPGRKPC